ncbi:TonB-dependent siderophore receptor [Alcaligenes endophyticus]|uniref:TonB-dependent siderophore receptor n=1 Tax=Alcaligenes endophyticus TaxID=1929088 RepID=UPI002251E015|nr:TonB-dependent siderophore receptor [Alcaligenes endophyticus]MCX5591873.1 TonB-dependent siderophore receptor [Alcaligenes endophyticus]
MSFLSSKAVPPASTARPYPSFTVATLTSIYLATVSTVSHADAVQELDRIVITAEQELKQTLGASTITAEDIQKSSPANDASEIIRTMPGVNLTGNSTSGQRGNNRQIDIRGMGPENTLILVDGKPVNSRSAVRFGWRGERDTRGDTNWVPAEQIERIEVLRGPAAARYGNGAAGGVVNIITRPTSEKLSGSLHLYGNLPEHSVDGASRRANINLSGPLAENLSFRVYGNYNHTQPDDYDINKNHATPRGGSNLGTFPAGREGVKNKDINALLRWQLTPGHALDLEAAYSRQGNIYAGDTQNTNNNWDPVKDQLGNETNITYRQSYSLTHHGDWNDKTNSLSYLQYESTRNTRLDEGMAGGTEGRFSGGFNDIDLKSLTAHTEVTRTFTLGSLEQAATFGIEWSQQKLNDPASNLGERNPPGPRLPGAPRAYTSKLKADIYSLFAESNIYAGDATTITPGLRFDHHNQYGNNWSPSLNISHFLGDNWTVKGGIARAYKAPNLYQGNDGYTLYSRGIGCWGGQGTACFLQGNSNLKAETSINKELGIEYLNDDGLAGSLTYFHNDYRDKVEAGHDIIGSFIAAGETQNIFQWENVPKAVIQGLEGSFTLPISAAWNWQTNLTYMIESKNKTTGEALSTIPKYTINSILDWTINPQWSARVKATLYGEQKPPKYDYNGKPLEGQATDKMSPYAILDLSTQYQYSKHLRFNVGIDNVFDKRIFRRGNAIGVNMGTPNFITGAGAYTYNQPGRVYFLSVTSSF